MNFIKKNKQKVALIFLIAVYCLIFIFISIWKYSNFQYNELDLAIFNQTFYNTAHGNLFENSIQNQSYLGDHFAPLMLLILPFYMLFQSPVILLILQTIVIGLGAIPVFLISGKILKNDNYAILFVFLYLANFTVQSMNVDGFHMLPFALTGLLLMFYFYLEKNFLYFLISLFFCLLIREDVALVIIPFIFIPLIDRRSKKWVLTPLILGILYFVFAIKFVSYFNQDDSYKFLVYYNWLGSGFIEIIKNIFFHPFKVFLHVLRPGVFEVIIGFLMPFIFLSLLRIKYLLPLVFIFAMHFLKRQGGEIFVLNSYYGALFIPFFLISAIYGFKKVKNHKVYGNYVISVVVIFATIYTSMLLSPLSVFGKIKREKELTNDAKIQHYLACKIKKDSKIITTADFLPNLSSRKDIYSLHYIFLGNKQFSDKQYEIPDDIEYALINLDEFTFYYFQYLGKTMFTKPYLEGDNRIRDLMEKQGFHIYEKIGQYLLYKKDNDPGNIIENYKVISENSFEKQYNVNYEFEQGIKLLRAEKEFKIKKINEYDIDYLDLNLYWNIKNKINENYFVTVTLTDTITNKKLIKNIPIGYGLYPLPEWETGNIIFTNYQILIPNDFRNLIRNYDYSISVAVTDFKGDAYFNYLGSVELLVFKSLEKGKIEI